MQSYEERVESSIPVQARISMVVLAELTGYWERKGIRINSMSQLVSWSLELLKQSLIANGQMSEDEVSVEEANRLMIGLGLYQPGLRGRTRTKIAHTLAFESMRDEGVDPRVVASAQYNTLHNANSVKAPESEVIERIRKVPRNQSLYNELVEIERKRKEEEIKNAKEAVIKQARESGVIAEVDGEGKVMKEGMSSEELNNYDKERERKVREKENAPVDPEWMKKVVIKDRPNFE